MTARADDREAALALLRAEFPEPLWNSLSLSVSEVGWHACAIARHGPLDARRTVHLSSWGDTPDAAARALIAAWREATGRDVAKKEARDA